MRGRRPSGPEYVERLAGSAQAKERLKVVLQTLAGTCRVQDACRQLGISEPRFQQLRSQMLAAALAGLEPQPIGRPPQARSPQQQQLAALSEQLANQEIELHAAQAREEIALILPRLTDATATPEKKTRPPTAATRRRRRGRKKHT